MCVCWALCAILTLTSESQRLCSMSNAFDLHTPGNRHTETHRHTHPETHTHLCTETNTLVQLCRDRQGRREERKQISSFFAISLCELSLSPYFHLSSCLSLTVSSTRLQVTVMTLQSHCCWQNVRGWNDNKHRGHEINSEMYEGDDRSRAGSIKLERCRYTTRKISHRCKENVKNTEPSVAIDRWNIIKIFGEGF